MICALVLFIKMSISNLGDDVPGAFVAFFEEEEEDDGDGDDDVSIVVVILVDLLMLILLEI